MYQLNTCSLKLRPIPLLRLEKKMAATEPIAQAGCDGKQGVTPIRKRVLTTVNTTRSDNAEPNLNRNFTDKIRMNSEVIHHS